MVKIWQKFQKILPYFNIFYNINFSATRESFCYAFRESRESFATL